MLDLTRMSRAELLALVNGLAVMLKLNDNIVIAINDKGESFAVYSLPKPQNLHRAPFAFDCAGLCGQDLKRPHLTCFVCRYRKIKKGKLPNIVPVTVYFLAMGKNRHFERLQAWLVKKLLALVEFVALSGEGHGVLHKR